MTTEPPLELTTIERATIQRMIGEYAVRYDHGHSTNRVEVRRWLEIADAVQFGQGIK